MAEVNYINTRIEMEDGESVWAVLETATEQFIEFFFLEDDAVEYTHFLNSGGVFDGHTPAFFLIEFNVNRDMDVEFETLFEDMEQPHYG